MGDTFKFTEGCVYEGGKFEIETNARVGEKCRHCHSEEVETWHPPGHPEYTKIYRSWVCPAVVVGHNMGGAGEVKICLQCILEASGEIMTAQSASLR